MLVKRIVVVAMLAVCLGGWNAIGSAQTATADSATKRIDPEKIRVHVRFLAHDLLEGRGTGQRGGDIAAEYIAAQFALDGLKPAGDDGTFFQSVPMVGVKTLPETTMQFAAGDGSTVELKDLDDFVVNNESQMETADIDAPIVFVGYGIKAPEYNWDDYKDVDLRGKVALLFVNEPNSDDPNFFKGKALTYYGRWTYKYEETARRGAIATLIIHRTDLASYGWDVVRNSWGNERSYLKRDETPKLQAASWIQLEIAKKLVGMAGLDLDKLFQQAQSRDFKPITLPVHLKSHVVSRLRPFVSRNVLAMLPGTDAHLKHEAVFYSAHYDHLGIDPNLKGDNIYNGAIDNATGCAILLEMARVWAASQAPKRSIYFASVTAEEQGLLGSEYLGKHSPVPPRRIALDLNYDALAPIGIPEEVEVSGAERTTFYPVVQATAKKFGLTIRPDARPEAGHYYRSDHFSFARVGVPAFSVGQGMKFKDHDAAWGEAQAKDYTDHHYHQPSDEYHPEMEFAGLAKMTAFGYVLGRQAASQQSLIGWQHGDEFEPARKRSQATDPTEGRLFENVPSLRVVHYEPVYYPPLARQTRISGSVRIRVQVDGQGHVSKVSVISGHPFLTKAVQDNISKWKFAPLAEGDIEFELTYEFVLGDDLLGWWEHQEVFFDAPAHIQIVSYPQTIETNVTNVAMGL